jgi:GNAT superfamily N-acetyltransferase
VKANLPIDVATVADLPALGGLRAAQGWLRPAALLRAIVEWEGGRIFVIREGALNSASATPLAPAVTTSVIAAGQVGVIGNVIVREDFRRRGLGRLIMNATLDWLRSRGVRWALLDATADGYPLYLSLGFVEAEPSWFGHVPLVDIRRSVLAGQAADVRVLLRESPDMRRLATLDTAAFGGDRTGFLELVLPAPGTALYVAEDASGSPSGYLIVRAIEAPYVGGRLGPWVARDTGTAAALLARALAGDAPWRASLGDVSDADAELFVTPPGTNPHAVELLRTIGVHVVRDDVVMRLALARRGETGEPVSVADHPEWLYAWLAPMVF